MTTVKSRLLIVAALLATAAVTGASDTNTAIASAAIADPSHPYSDPVWSPLRAPARISCVKTNCAGTYHGYDAIDLVGELGDPIYAAGAGVFHVGGVAPACTTGTPTRGTWVWIDHGPAGSTRYHHLDSITAVDGQLVTPNTQIGTMGHSGDNYPCTVNYLHMELRDSELVGTRRQIPNFTACSAGRTLQLPQDLGFDTWDDVTAQQYYTPDTDNTCIPGNSSATPERPAEVSVEPGVGTMTVDLPSRPAGIDDVRVRLELYHPSLEQYGFIIEKRADPSVETVGLEDLLVNRRYRASISYHNSIGWSAWSEPVVSQTGFVPETPAFRESFSTATTISYKWFRGENSDAGFEVAIRRSEEGVWGPWTYVDVPSAELSHRFRDLWPGATYQVTVRSKNEFATSRFSSYRSITTVCHTVCAEPPKAHPFLKPAVRISLEPTQGDSD